MGNCCTDDRQNSLKKSAKGQPFPARVGAKQMEADTAFQQGDIKTIVELIKSMDPYDMKIEKVGTFDWQEHPTTIGAAAIRELTIKAASATDDSPLKDQIREAGGIEPMVQNLSAPQKDRQQWAVQGLSALT